jgi:hypothetical protein
VQQVGVQQVEAQQVKLRQFARAGGELRQRSRPVPVHERPPAQAVLPGNSG